MKSCGNSNLHKAKSNKNDEFYTRYEDIENELKHYANCFTDKTIYCNCDNPKYSNFWKYFINNFEKLHLKKLIATYYNPKGKSYKWTYIGYGLATQYELKGDGDFRSPESVETLKEADIVVSNSPFSLFRKYIAQLMEYQKKFLVIGNMNAITYKEIFPLIKGNELWTGFKSYGGGMNMIMPSHNFDPKKVNKYTVNDNGEIIVNIMGVIWFTNLDIKKRHEELILYKRYNPDEYPHYDNYDAINVDKVKDIPEDYDGVMGVPITFLDKYCPEQFEIIGLGNGRSCFSPNKDYINPVEIKKNGSITNGNALNRVLAIKVKVPPENSSYYKADNSGILVAPYARILIRKLPTYHPGTLT